jgi:hypothetical protein
MSGPIRKVGGTTGTPDVSDVGGGDGEAFRASLDATRPADATKATGAATSITELASAVKSGALEPSAVIDRLVEKALSAPAAQGLTDAGRLELERALRSALAEDPTLLALQADLGRGA